MRDDFSGIGHLNARDRTPLPAAMVSRGDLFAL